MSLLTDAYGPRELSGKITVQIQNAAITKVLTTPGATADNKYSFKITTLEVKINNYLFYEVGNMR